VAALATTGCVAGQSPAVALATETPPSEARATSFPATETAFAPATAEAACSVPEPQVIEQAYPSAAAHGEVPVLIVLPPCYDASRNVYPVVYFLHGKPMTEQQWRDLGLPELLAQGWAEGRWPALVAVAPRQPEPLFSNSDGGPGSYEEEFLQGLVPFIESNLAVEDRAEGRAVEGISRGGVWALELALTHPEAIGQAAALSPALAVNYARPAYDPLQLAVDATALPRLFLGAGRDDWARAATERLGRLLLEREADIDVDLVEGGHDDSTWLQLLPPALDFLTAPWKVAADQASEIR